MSISINNHDIENVDIKILNERKIMIQLRNWKIHLKKYRHFHRLQIYSVILIGVYILLFLLCRNQFFQQS